MPGSSTSRIWGRPSSSGPTTRRRRAALEALTPGDFVGLGPGRIRYTLLIDDDGGIIDDLMVTRRPSRTMTARSCLVVNAARKDDRLRPSRRPPAAAICARRRRRSGAARVAGAARPPTVMARHCREGGRARLHDRDRRRVRRHRLRASRAPAIPARTASRSRCRPTDAEAFARALLAEPEVLPIGLGARDSLRLEAGLCLYGHDIDETTLAGRGRPRLRRSPSAAGAEGGFPGADRIVRELAEGPSRLRVGIAPEGKAPAREGAAIPTWRPADRRRHLRRLRPDRRRPDRHGLCRAALRRARHASSRSIVRGKAVAGHRRRAALRSPPLFPQSHPDEVHE